MKNGMCTRSDARDHTQQPHQESELPASVAGTPQASRARVVGILPRATSKKGPQKNPVSAAGSCLGERGGSSWLSRAKRSLWAQDPSPFGICAEICADAPGREALARAEAEQKWEEASCHLVSRIDAVLQRLAWTNKLICRRHTASMECVLPAPRFSGMWEGQHHKHGVGLCRKASLPVLS